MDDMNDMNELPEDLARALKALDARAERAAGKVDSARVAEAVLKRLGEPDIATRRPLWRMTGVRVAAAVVLLAASAVTAQRIFTSARASLPLALQADSMSVGDLNDALQAVDEARLAGSSIVSTTVTVDDLTETELKALLAALESTGETS